MPRSSEHQQEQQLLQQLRTHGYAVFLQDAAQLEKAYHDQEMTVLSTDVYESAKQFGSAPPGWIRASEHLDMLRAYAPHIQLSDTEIRKLLKPEKSGFRAEIYLPDSQELGPGYKPAVVFKGSSGEVMTSHGLRDTTMEDFIANNFPQSIGLETDYYDRAMALAMNLKFGKLDFELAGHSLAGGMASAASAVTGMPATTFNAAGLHPETTRRFAQQNGLPVYDVSQRVTAYQVQGELLNDGVQNNIRGMDAIRRAELGDVLQETSRLLKELPQGRALLQQKLQQNIPTSSQATVHDFVDALARDNTDHLLRELPLAAGHVVPLAALTERDGQRVPREAALTLPEVTVLGEPVLELLRDAAIGARWGERGGTLAMAAQAPMLNALQASAHDVNAVSEWGAQLARDTTRFAGMAVQTSTRLSGVALAQTRQGVAEVEAQLDRGIGQGQSVGASLDAGLLRGAGSVLPDAAQQWMNERAQQLERVGEEAHHHGELQAERARGEGQRDAATIGDATQSIQALTQTASAQLGEWQHDAIATSGHWAGHQLQAAHDVASRVAVQAPTLGAATGAVVGIDAAMALGIQPGNYPRLMGAVTAVSHGKQAGEEAFGRHLMRATVLPSMDGYIDQLEHAVKQRLQRSMEPSIQQTPKQAEPQAAKAQNSFSATLDRMLAAADVGDWKRFDRDTQALAEMAPGRDMWNHAVGMVKMEDRLVAQHQTEMQQLHQSVQQTMQQQPAMSQGHGMSR